MKRLFTTLLILLTTTTMQGGQTIERLIGNINEITLQNSAPSQYLSREFIKVSNHGRVNDLMIIELYTSCLLPDDCAQELVDSFTEQRVWSDIDYDDTTRSPWKPALHLTRCYALTKLYFSEESKFYKSDKLLTLVLNAIDYWHENRATLICPNWWYNQIFAPRQLGQIYLLLQDKLTEEQKTIGCEIMENSTLSMTGQNKVWLAGNVLMRGLLESDIELVERARDAIAEEIYLSLGEGLQYDNSFHQHGEQMQFGNYGLAYINSLVYWCRALRDTRLSIPTYKRGVLSDYILDGIQWTAWRGRMDPNSAARQVFENSQRGKIYSMATSIRNMREVESENIALYDSFLERNLYDTARENDLVGTKCFYHSDYFIKRASNWYASIRMNSSRTLPYEMTNRENLQGAYSADGVMILCLDGDEYDNIYPLWDWKRLPGLTYFDSGEEIPYNSPKEPINSSSFVGGVSAGEDGVAVMHYQDSLIELRKGYFFIDDVVVSLGADINIGNSHPASTTLVQRFLRDGEAITLGVKNGLQRSLGADIHQGELRWLHHDKVGYYLPELTTLEVSAQSRERSWHRIADIFPEDKMKQGDIFTASILHPDSMQGGTYSYITLPDRSVKQVEHFAKSPTVEILENSGSLQAVATLDRATIGAIFHKATTLYIDRDFHITLDKPAVVLLEQGSDGYKVTISDPSQELEKLTLSIVKGRRGSRVEMSLPFEEGYRGSSLSIEINL